MKVFVAYGLNVNASVDLPGGLLQNKRKLSDPDLSILFGTNAMNVGPTKTEGSYSLYNNHLLFTLPTLETYRCDKHSVVIDKTLTKGQSNLLGILIATALPAVLWLRGEIVLHSAGLVLQNHTTAIAIAGPSGSGKSTLLRQLVEQGSRVIGDDTLRLIVNNNQIMISGLPGLIFYRDSPLCSVADRQVQQVSPEKTLTTAPLRNLLILEQTCDEVSITPLNKIDSLIALMRQIHRPVIVRLLSTMPNHFEDSITWSVLLNKMTWISECINIYVWRRRRGDLALSDFERDKLQQLMI